MQTLRDLSIEVIKSLPESSSLEDIMHKVNLTAQVIKGLEDEKNGKTISTEELLGEINAWKDK